MERLQTEALWHHGLNNMVNVVLIGLLLPQTPIDDQEFFLHHVLAMRLTVLISFALDILIKH